jgi:hypothetical protein
MRILNSVHRGAAGASLVAATATVAAMLATFPTSAIRAALQPPTDRCRAASKLEYNSARKQFLLRSRFGMYVRTGWAWRRRYWYCQF